MRKTAKMLMAAMMAVGSVLMATAPRAAASGCQQDGVAAMCAATKQSQDALGLVYQITQVDGPGTYELYYVDTSDNSTGGNQTIGPLDNQAVANGTILTLPSRCYDLHLDSTAGTSLVIPALCG